MRLLGETSYMLSAHLSRQQGVHVLRGEAAGEAEDSALEGGGEDVDEDDDGEGGGQEPVLPGVGVHLHQTQGQDEEHHHHAQGDQQPGQ